MNKLTVFAKKEIEKIINNRVKRLTNLITSDDATPRKISYLFYSALNEICSFLKIHNFVKNRKEEIGLKKTYACFFYSSIFLLETKFYDAPEKKEFMENIKTNFATLSGMTEKTKKDLDKLLE